MNKEKTLALIGAVFGGFAVVAQYYLILENRVVDPFETTVRFFSFFTILTNALVALFFTFQLVKTDSWLGRQFARPGVSTALTVYIFVVGAVYFFLLRHLWTPTGLQRVVDEILHSVMPVLMLVYWFGFEAKRPVRWTKIPSWLLFPTGYLIYVLVRGSYAEWYPYPFVDAAKLSPAQLGGNIFGLVGLFAVLAFLFVGIGKIMARRRSPGEFFYMILKAPRAQVFRALTDAQAIARWRVPEGMRSEIHEFEARPGGRFRISLIYEQKDLAGKSSEHADTYHGRFQEWLENEKIVEVSEFESEDPGFKGEMVMTYRLRAIPEGTELTATHAGLPRGIKPEDNEAGWTMSLAKLKAFVERS
ncbi:MAG: Pr6Pr family membrane protein [Bdellovibrionaceae bacterium]|nr:Pr6Pr family membrane protein [Pseudobdellovibrionaceae bacterium]